MLVIDKQLQKVAKHYEALREYKKHIDTMQFDFSEEEFSYLDTPSKAVLEAYLKRFSSLQDYLGAKVFRSLLDISGIGYSKMSEVLADLKYCVENFSYLEQVVQNVFEFARRYNASIELPSK